MTAIRSRSRRLDLSCAACVALVAHPADERYQSLFGAEVLTPLFGVPVPVLPTSSQSRTRGSGIR